MSRATNEVYMLMNSRPAVSKRIYRHLKGSLWTRDSYPMEIPPEFNNIPNLITQDTPLVGLLTEGIVHILPEPWNHPYIAGTKPMFLVGGMTMQNTQSFVTLTLSDEGEAALCVFFNQRPTKEHVTSILWQLDSAVEKVCETATAASQALTRNTTHTDGESSLRSFLTLGDRLNRGDRRRGKRVRIHCHQEWTDQTTSCRGEDHRTKGHKPSPPNVQVPCNWWRRKNHDEQHPRNTHGESFPVDSTHQFSLAQVAFKPPIIQTREPSNQVCLAAGQTGKTLDVQHLWDKARHMIQQDCTLQGQARRVLPLLISSLTVNRSQARITKEAHLHEMDCRSSCMCIPMYHQHNKRTGLDAMLCHHACP